MKALLLGATALVAATLAAAAQPAPAAGNLERLRGMQPTGTALELETVPQTGRAADRIRRNLANIQLPPGFAIDLYAVVPDARHMAVGTNAGVVYVGTRKTRLWAVTDRTRARTADEVKVFAPSIAFRQPNGVCFSKDGQLYVAEHNRVLVFPAAEFFYEGPDVAVDVVAEQLVPKSEESFNHGARTCTIGPDNKLYITLGQPYNVPPPGKAELYAREGIGGIIRMDRDGKNREVFARGIRNSVGHDWNPRTNELWFTDNQVDGMGDDVPPGELNHAPRAGMHFGFPWYGGGHTRTIEYKDSDPPGRRHLPRRRDGRPRRRPRHALLPRPHVPRAVPRRHLQRPARILEPHRPRRRPRHGHDLQARRHRRQVRALRLRLAQRRDRRVQRPPGGRRRTRRRQHPGVRRLRRRHLPHQLQGPLMRLAIGALLILAAPFLGGPARAQDVQAGRRIAARACSACHGTDGIAKVPEAANLAGQDATYLTRQLDAFRSGARTNEQMSVIAKTITDQQSADVAAYYNAIRIEVVSTPGP